MSASHPQSNYEQNLQQPQHAFQKKIEQDLYQARPEFKEAVQRLRSSVKSAGLIGLMELKRQFKIYQKDAQYLDKVRRANIQTTGSSRFVSSNQSKFLFPVFYYFIS